MCVEVLVLFALKQRIGWSVVKYCLINGLQHDSLFSAKKTSLSTEFKSSQLKTVTHLKGNLLGRNTKLPAATSLKRFEQQHRIHQNESAVPV